MAQQKLTALNKINKIKNLKSREFLILELTKLAKVSLYDFETSFPGISNLDNYKDLIHYSEKINHFMVESFLTGTCKVTQDNIDVYQQKFLELDKTPFVEGLPFLFLFHVIRVTAPILKSTYYVPIQVLQPIFDVAQSGFINEDS